MVLHATIAGREVDLDSDAVVRTLSRVDPEPIRKHYVVVAGRKLPVRQALSAVTGIDKAEFQSHQARSIFRRLGLPTGQLGSDWTPRPALRSQPGRRRSSTEDLRQYVGQYVAIADGEVLHASRFPLEVVEWLRRHLRVADSMFRVPVDPSLDMPKFDL